ncbi:hypothetical protein GCM10009603_36640 [Nocardiopsis exhalans]
MVRPPRVAPPAGNGCIKTGPDRPTRFGGTRKGVRAGLFLYPDPGQRAPWAALCSICGDWQESTDRYRLRTVSGLQFGAAGILWGAAGSGWEHAGQAPGGLARGAGASQNRAGRSAWVLITATAARMSTTALNVSSCSPRG